MKCALTEKQLENLFLYNSNLLFKYQKNNMSFNLEKHILNIYNKIAEKSDFETALQYVQFIPKYSILAINKKKELKKYLRKNGLSTDKLDDLEEQFENIEGIKKFLKKINPNISKEDIEETKKNVKEEIIEDRKNISQEEYDKNVHEETKQKKEIWIAKPETVFSLTGQENLIVDGKEIRNPNLIHFYNFIKKLYNKLSEFNNDFKKAKIGNHKGFKIKLITGNKLPIKYASKDEQVFYNKEEKNKFIYRNGVKAVITDLNGNVLFFDENHNVVNKDKGKPIYYNIRTPKLVNGKYVLEKAKIQTPLEIYNKTIKLSGLTESEYLKTNNSTKEKELEYIERQQQVELKTIYDIRESLKKDKNKELLFDISGISPGVININFGNVTLSNKIDWENSDIPFNPVLIKTNSQNKSSEKPGNIYIRIPGRESIRLYRKNFSEKDVEKIIELIFNKDLKILGKKLSFESRLELLKSLTYTSKDSIMLFQNKNDYRIVIKNKTLKLESEEDILKAKQEVKNILTTPFLEKDGTPSYRNTIFGIYNIRKTENNTVLDFDIENGNVKTKEIPFKEYVLNHTFTTIDLTKTKHNSINFTNGYLVVDFSKFYDKENESFTKQEKTNLEERKKRKDVYISKRKKRRKKKQLRANKNIKIKVSKEKERKAKEWFEKSDLSKFIDLNTLFSIVNSNAFATFKKSSITLYKGSNYNLLYHEAWHAFTEEFLSYDEQVELYNTFEKTKIGKDLINKKEKKLKRKLSEEEKFLILEEYLAEDFREFMNNGKSKLSYDKGIKGIFQRIVDFLKALFNNSESKSSLKINKLYTILKTGKLNHYSHSKLNSYFTKDLYYSFEPLKGNESEFNISGDDVVRAVKSTDSIILSLIREENSKIGSSKFLTDLINNPIDYLPELIKKAEQQFKNRYNSIIKEIEKLEEEDPDNIKIDELYDLTDSLDIILDNFGLNEENLYESKGFVKLYLSKSVLNELNVNLEEEPDFFKKQLSDKQEHIIENIKSEIKFLFSILRERDKNGLVLDKFGFPQLIPFIKVYKKLKIFAYQNNRSPKQFKNKLLKELNENKEYWIQDLINYTTNDGSNLKQFTLETSLWQSLFYTKIPLIQTNVNIEDGNVNITVGEASAVFRNVSNDIRSHFKTVKNNPFIEFDREEGNVLNVKKLVQYYKSNNIIPEDNPIDFLENIGFPSTSLNNISEVEKKQLSNAVTWFYDRLIKLDKNNIKVTDIITALKDDIEIIKEQNKIILKGEAKNLKNVLKIESLYSDKYANVGVLNPEGNVEYEDVQHSTLSIIIEDLNSLNDYNDIYNFKHLSHLYIENNPSIKNSLLFNSLFEWNEELNTFGKRKKNKLNISKISGTQTIEENDPNYDFSSKTSSEDEVTRLLQDLHNGLLFGKFSNLTPSDKGTIYSVTVDNLLENPIIKTRNLKNIKFLYGDYKSLGTKDNFSNLLIESSTEYILGYLDNALKRITSVKKNLKNPGTLPNIPGYTIGEDENSIKGLSLGFLEEILDYVPGLKEEFLKYENLSELNFLNEEDNVARELYKKTVKAVEQYFNDSYERTLKVIPEDLYFIDSSIKNKIKKDLKELGFTEKELTDSIVKKVALKTYVINSFFHHAENFILIYGDLTQYKDIFKRNYAFQSQGNMHRTDQDAFDLINTEIGRPFEEKYKKENNIEKPYRDYNGTLNTIIFEEVSVKSELVGTDENGKYKEYTKAVIDNLLKKGHSEEEAVELEKIINKPYYEMDEADAGAGITIDTYRILGILNDSWSNEQEALFQKILNNPEDVLVDDIMEYFPPRKYQYAGPIEMKGFNATAFHKYALLPLIPTVIKNKKLQDVAEKMYKLGADYYTFQSGSKVSSVTKDGKFPKLYKDLNTRELNDFEDEVELNVIYTHYLKDQLKINSKFKGKTIFSTQLRTLIEDGLIENGLPIDFEKELSFTERKEKWESLSEIDKFSKSIFYSKYRRYESKMEKYIELQKLILKKELGLDNENSDMSKLISVIKDELSREDLADHELEFIKVDLNGNLDVDLSFSPSASKIERALNALVNKRLVNQKMKGESLVQVPTTLFEPRKADDEEKKKYGATNDMKSYTKDSETGKTLAAEFKIALQGDFKKLLHLKHKDGKKIMVYRKREYTTFDGQIKYIKEVNQKESLKRLNETIQDKEWRSKKENKDLISMVGVRIPVQGLNSMEHMIVWEFLPEEAGNIIIPPSEIVAKSGADFDVDKLTILFPSIEIIEGEVVYIEDTDESTDVSNIIEDSKKLKEELKELEKIKKELQSLYSKKFEDEIKNASLTDEQQKEKRNLLNPFYSKLKEIKKDLKTLELKMFNLENIENPSEQQIKQYEKIANNYNNLIDEYDLIYDDLEIVQKEFGTKIFKENLNKFELERDTELDPIKNRIIDIKRELAMKSPKGIQNAILTEMKDILSLEHNFLSLITPNSTDLFTNEGGLVDEFRKIKKTDESESSTRILEPYKNVNVHARNSIGKETLGISANANVFNILLNRIGAVLNDNYYSITGKERRIELLLKHNSIDNKISLSNIFNIEGIKIADIINQLMNGYVDIAKEDWVFDINAVKEVSNTLFFLIQSGVSLRESLYFLSNPLVVQYVNEIKKLKSPFAKANNLSPENAMFIMSKAKYNIIKQINGLNHTLDHEKERVKKDKLYQSTIARTKDIKTLDNKKILNLSFNEALSDYNSIASFLHFLEIDDIAKELNNVRKSIKLDTTKNTTLFDAIKVEKDIKKIEKVKLLPEETIKKAFEETPTGKFRVGPFQLDIWKNLFNIRNNVKLNEYLLKLIEKPTFFKDLKKTFNDEEKFVEEFKNDLIIYLFENKLKKTESEIIESNFYKDINLQETSDDVIPEIIEDDEGNLIMKYNLNFLKKIFNDKSYLKNSNDKNSFINLGLSPINEKAFLNTSFDEFLNYMFENAYLKNEFPFEAIKESSLIIKEAHEIVKITKKEELNLELAYENLIKNLSLNNIFNIWKLFYSNNTIAHEVLGLSDLFPHLKENYYLFENLKLSSPKNKKGSKNKTITNLTLIDTKLDPDLYTVLHNNVIDLSEEGVMSLSVDEFNPDKSYFENALISNYFNVLQYVAYIQTGLKSYGYNSITRLMDQNILSNSLDNLDINSILSDEFLEEFKTKFIIQNHIKKANERGRLKNYFKKSYDNITEIKNEEIETKDINENLRKVQQKIKTITDALNNSKKQGSKELEEILLDLKDKDLVETNNKKVIVNNSGRDIIIFKINDVLLPFYKSFKGTQGKEKGRWYPVITLTEDWIVKGMSDNYKDGYGNKYINEILNTLNKNFKYDNSLNSKTKVNISEIRKKQGLTEEYNDISVSSILNPIVYRDALIIFTKLKESLGQITLTDKNKRYLISAKNRWLENNKDGSNDNIIEYFNILLKEFNEFNFNNEEGIDNENKENIKSNSLKKEETSKQEHINNQVNIIKDQDEFNDTCQ